MTTPTPMKHGPSQQGRTPNGLGTAPTPRTTAATPPVSTPFSAMHAVFSPPPGSHGPRSSPHQFKKSPANSGTILGHPNNPLPVSYDSPSAAAAFGHHLAMGDIPLDIGTPAASAINAAIGSIQNADEDDRLRRLTKVMEVIEPFKGHVSEAGLARLASRTGLEHLWETTNINGIPVKTVIIAGKAVSVDIVCSNNLVISVALAFPGADDVVNKHAEQANKILLRNLKLKPGQSPLTKTLEDFASNLERLAGLDKLCVLPGLNCHEAIAGIYESLEKLFRWDVEKSLVINPHQSRYVAEMAALCTRHGRPLMHARARLGMSLDYWKERWLVPSRTPPDADYLHERGTIFSLLIGCTKSDGKLSSQGIAYPAVRVAKNWISDSVERFNPTPEEALMSNGPILDWQEPDLTFIRNPAHEPKANETAQDILMDCGKFPEVIFTTTFDPPLVVPLYHWQTLCTLFEESMQNQMDLETYDNLLFPPLPGESHDNSEPRQLRKSKKYPCFSNGAEGRKLVDQRHTIYINKRIYGHTLKELPFSHPRQLVTMMPILRQCALLTTLLEVSFGAKSEQDPESYKVSNVQKKVPATTQSVGDGFDSFMDGVDTYTIVTAAPIPDAVPAARDNDNALAVDMTLFLHPIPAIKINFPLGDGASADLTVEIRQDGMVNVQSQNLVPMGSEKHHQMEKALQVLCNLGMWVNWIRGSFLAGLA